VRAFVLRLAALAVLGVSTAAFAGAPAARAASVPWCGSGEPTADVADAVNAFEWHIVYATPSDGVDRFESYAPRIAGDAAALSGWWVGQDATRRPRFDLVDAPGCASEYGRVDISLVAVAPGHVMFSDVVADVRAAGFESPDKGYLVYFDGTPHAGSEYGVCGQGGTDDVAWAYVVVYLQTCEQASNDDTRAMVATHEMVHGMGAVQSPAPHSCDSGHVCDSPSDLLKAVSGPGDWLGSLTLDVGRDDYYGHSGNWWDVQDSQLLYRLDQSLVPPADIVGLTATGNVAGVVRVGWDSSARRPQDVGYRIYDGEGRLVTELQRSSTIVASGAVGSVLVRTIRAENDAGFLSRPATIRFKIGHGIVDAAGALLKDTVAPNGVGRLRASVSKSRVVLRWAAVADPIGLRGYRVTAAGLRPLLVATTTARLPLARVRGKVVSVAAVDRAGNVGRAASARVRR